jgi:hypothetical protein
MVDAFAPRADGHKPLLLLGFSLAPTLSPIVLQIWLRSNKENDRRKPCCEAKLGSFCELQAALAPYTSLS